MRLALIDADLLLYRCAYSQQEKHYTFGGTRVVVPPDLEAATKSLDIHVNRVKEVVGATQVLMCLSAPTVFRKEVLPTYKDGRPPRPTLYGPLREYIETHYETRCVPLLEADDVLGIIGSSNPHSVMCSIDKDLMQIPGTHYSWSRPDEGVFSVNQEEADLAFWIQCLSGDSTDNYKGIPGIGPIKAAKILTEPCEEAVVDAYLDRCFSWDYMLQQCRCARILRAYDFKNKEIQLWTPKET